MVVRRPADELIYNGMGVWTFYALFAKDALVEDSWRGVGRLWAGAPNPLV